MAEGMCRRIFLKTCDCVCINSDTTVKPADDFKTERSCDGRT